MIEAVRFVRALRSGSSLPLVLTGDDGRDYVVKLSGAGDGPTANVVEWLAAGLGGLLGLPVPPVTAVNIGPEPARQAADPEVSELLERSVGMNPATAWISDARQFTMRDLENVDPGLKRDLFLHDVFLLNVDRTVDNPNLVIARNRIQSLDHSASMTLRAVVTGQSYRLHALLRRLRHHPFYDHDVSVIPYLKCLRGLDDAALGKLVDSVPAVWVAGLESGGDVDETRKKLAARLTLAVRRGLTLRKRLDLLRVFHVPTDSETRTRIALNKRRFERRVRTSARRHGK